MFGKLLGPDIQVVIQERNFAALKQIFSEWPPADMAELISDLPIEDQVILFRLLPRDLAGGTFEYLSRPDQVRLLKAMGREEIVKVINEMAPDDRTALLEELPGSAVQELVRQLSPEERAVAQSLLNYPVKSVGRLMTPDFIAIRDDWTMKQVLDFVRENGSKSETINVLYVLDEQGQLIDDIRIRDILVQPLERKVSEIRNNSFVALRASDLAQDAVQIFRKYDRTVLPVIDSVKKLLGIVTVDDILDILEKETTEDIQKLGGSQALNRPYMETSILEMTRKRAPWLVVLFLSEMLTTTAMGFFEDEIARAVVLALFLPLIISSGGNSGSQATTLIIRAMAIGEVRLRDWWRVMRRELAGGLFLGLILGTIGFLRIAVWSMFSHVYGPHWMLVATTVGLSLIGVVLWGTLSGSMLPFALRRCGLDPATSSAPFVATLVDVTGLVIYFTIAWIVLRGTLL